MIIKVAADPDISYKHESCREKDMIWTVAGTQPFRAGLPALGQILSLVSVDGKGFNEMGYDVCVAERVAGEVVAGEEIDIEKTPLDYGLRSGRTVYIKRLKASRLSAEVDSTAVQCGDEFAVVVTALDARGNRRPLPPQGRIRLHLKLLTPTKLNAGAELLGKTFRGSGDGTRDSLTFQHLKIEKPGMFVVRCDYVNPRGTCSVVTPCSTQVFSIEASDHPALSDISLEHLGLQGLSLTFDSSAAGHLCCLLFRSEEGDAGQAEAVAPNTSVVRTYGQAHEIAGQVGEMGSAQIRATAFEALAAERRKVAMASTERGLEEGEGHGIVPGCLAARVFDVAQGRQTCQIPIRLVETATYSVHFMTDNHQGTNPSDRSGCVRVRVRPPVLPTPEFPGLEVESLPGGADGVRVSFDATAVSYLHYCIAEENMYHPTRPTDITGVAERLHGGDGGDEDEDGFYRTLSRTRSMGMKPVVPIQVPTQVSQKFATAHTLWKHAGVTETDVSQYTSPVPLRQEDQCIHSAGNIVVGKGLGHAHVVDCVRPLQPGKVYDFWYAPHPIDTAGLRRITRAELDVYPLQRATFVVPHEDPPEVRSVTLVQVSDLCAVRLRFELSNPGSIHYIICKQRPHYGMAVAPTAIINASTRGAPEGDPLIVCAGTFVGIPSGPHSFRLGHLPNRNVEHTHFPLQTFEPNTPYEAFVVANNTTLGNPSLVVARSAGPMVLCAKTDGEDTQGSDAGAAPVEDDVNEAVSLALKQALDKGRSAVLHNAREAMEQVLAGDFGDPPPPVTLAHVDAEVAARAAFGDGSPPPDPADADDFSSIESDPGLTLGLLQVQARVTAAGMLGEIGPQASAQPESYPPLPKMSEGLLRTLLAEDSDCSEDAVAAGSEVPCQAAGEEVADTEAAPPPGGTLLADGRIAPFVELDPTDPAVLKFFASSSECPGDEPDLEALQSLLSENVPDADEAEDGVEEGAKQRARRVWREYHGMMAKIEDLQSTLKTCQTDLSTAAEEYETYRVRLEGLIGEVRKAKAKKQQLETMESEHHAVREAEAELECRGTQRELAEVEEGNKAWAEQCRVLDERNSFLESTLEALRVSKTTYIHALEERCVKGRVEALAIPDHTDDVFALRAVKDEQDEELARLREILEYFKPQLKPDPPRKPSESPPPQPPLHAAPIITRRLAVPCGGLRVLTTIRGGGLQALRFKHHVNADVVTVGTGQNELEVTGEPENVLAMVQEVEAIYAQMQHLLP